MGPQAVLAAAGILARREADPGLELRGLAELLAVTHRGHDSRRADRADALQHGGLLDRRVVACVRGDALVAPGDVLIELATVALDGSLQDWPRLDAR